MCAIVTKLEIRIFLKFYFILEIILFFFLWRTVYVLIHKSVVLVASNGVFSNSFRIKKKKKLRSNIQIRFSSPFLPEKRITISTIYIIHYTLYRLQYRWTLTHRCTLKKYSSAVRRDSRSSFVVLFLFFCRITDENKNFTFMYSKTLYTLYCFPVLSYFH